MGGPGLTGGEFRGDPRGINFTSFDITVIGVGRIARWSWGEPSIGGARVVAENTNK